MRSGVSVSLFPLRRISTPHMLNLLEAIRGLKVYQMSFSTVTCANSEDKALKKHPIGCPFGTELCVRSCSVYPFSCTKYKIGSNRNILLNIRKTGVPKRARYTNDHSVKLKSLKIPGDLVLCVPITLFC